MEKNPYIELAECLLPEKMVEYFDVVKVSKTKETLDVTLEERDNGFDANKKVKGIKRNIAVDRNGFILGRYVSSAGIHDSRLASPVCEQVSDAWPTVRKGLVDCGYRGELIENIKRDFNIDIEVCSTPNGTNGFTPKPLRWVVERTF